MTGNTVVDALDLMMGYDEEEQGAVESKAIDEMLVESINQFGGVDLGYIAQGAGISMGEAALMLRGAIFQDPEVFIGEERYDIAKGWQLSASYLSGNIKEKLGIARQMNKRFHGRFERNIEALRQTLPVSVEIDEIYIDPGASWIPPEAEEQGLFLGEFLKLSEIPQVIYSRELGRFKILSLRQAENSVLNTITYGVRGEKEQAGHSWVNQYTTALGLFEDALNAKTVKIYDYIPKPGHGWNRFEYEPVFNKEKTLEAQDKQRQLVDAFRKWVLEDSSRKARFEEYYNEAFVGYTQPKYNGDFLTLPDLNPAIRPYGHQRSAIARGLLSGNNMLLAHDVGTGKTYILIICAHELKRMGLSNKTLVVVPNNILKATVDAHRLLYKEDDILVIYPKDFSPANRNKMLKQIRDGNYTAIYMAYSSFDMVVMGKEYYVDKMSRRIKELKSAAFNGADSYEKKALQRQAKALSKRLAKYMASEEHCPWLTYEQLGIDTLILDEAHNYKNIGLFSRTDNIVGMNNSGSKKCREMLEKAHNTSRLIFATGTPLTNSLADLYTLQMYLQPQVLRYHGLETFDRWVNTFGQKESFVECDVDANSKNLRPMTRFSSFHNLSELMSLFSQVCDFHHSDPNEEGLPLYQGPIDVTVPRNRIQTIYIKELSERTEKIRSKKVKRNEDNLLKITTDGRRAALDIRLTDKNISLSQGMKGKVDLCAEKLLQLYRAFPDTAQIVFSDIGTPKAAFNIYDCLAQRLCELGIPREEIAFVHDATTEAARSKLFEAMNKGQLRVVIGSTQKLGVGVNVQERLVALHHLSVPWRPADMVQREGRILRKGNTCKEIFVFRYITKGTFDAYSWQILENKQRFISSFLSGAAVVRSTEDIADAVLSYAEIKALCIGNKLIRQRVEVANRLERAKISSRARQREMQELRAVIDSAPAKLEQTRSLATVAGVDYAHYIACKEPIPNEERIAFGEELLSALAENEGKAEEQYFDTYQGFSVMLPANMSCSRSYILLKSVSGGSYPCELSLDKTPLGCSKTIDRLLEQLQDRSVKLFAQASAITKQVQEATADLEQDNPYLALVSEIQEELIHIDCRLKAGKGG